MVPPGMESGDDLVLSLEDWDLCPEFPDLNNGSLLSNTFMLEVYNMPGVSLFSDGPFTGFTPTSQVLIPSSTWNGPGQYVIRIIFANFTVVTRILTVN
jgi:hypothetical protein